MKARKTLTISFAALGIAAGIGLGIMGGNAVSSSSALLAANLDYQREQELIQIRNDVSRAEAELDYRPAYTTIIPISNGKTTRMIPISHPAEYPNPLYSIQALDSALGMYDSDPQNQTDLPGLDARLEAISGNLPRELDLRNYSGAKVNDSTFDIERTALNNEEKGIEQVIGSYDSKVPSYLKNQKRNGILELAGGIVLGLASTVAGAYGLMQDDEYY